MTKSEWKRKAAWLHSLRKCCLSGRSDIELAHLHEGSFMLGRKVSNVLVLPLSEILHKEQHRDPEFWEKALPGVDPKDEAKWLDCAWRQNNIEGAEGILGNMNALANKAYLTSILSKRIE